MTRSQRSESQAILHERTDSRQFIELKKYRTQDGWIFQVDRSGIRETWTGEWSGSGMQGNDSTITFKPKDGRSQTVTSESRSADSKASGLARAKENIGTLDLKRSYRHQGDAVPEANTFSIRQEVSARNVPTFIQVIWRGLSDLSGTMTGIVEGTIWNMPATCYGILLPGQQHGIWLSIVVGEILRWIKFEDFNDLTKKVHFQRKSHRGFYLGSTSQEFDSNSKFEVDFLQREINEFAVLTRF